MENIVDRFIRYIKVDTQSDATSDDCPSTPGQLTLAKILVDELNGLGLDSVELDENGYVSARLPSNINVEVPAIGFLAHMDTSPDFSGRSVNPKIISSYPGGEIILDPENRIKLDPDEFPELLTLKGEDLIVTDGSTLLGADDKAGIAEIMEAIKYLVEHPDIPHGTVKIAFTPDEEIGRGADKFQVKKFGADFAYTLDGGPLGELEFENFNAASARLEITGRNVHPGTAKNKMINAMQVGISFHEGLPKNACPECTEAYEGFYHLISFRGTVEHAVLEYIIRDHDKALFDEKKSLMEQLVSKLNLQWGAKTIQLTLRDQYYNMREKIEPVMHIVELAKQAMLDLDIKPDIKAIRGGTDGSKLSYMGLPTPNLFTGGYNFHGRYEFIPVSSMKKAQQVILQIIKRVATNHT